MLLLYFSISVGVFALYFILQIYVMYRVKMHFDFICKLLLITFTLCFLIRVIINTVCLNPAYCNDNNTTIDISMIIVKALSSIFDSIKWLVLYFYILEMQAIRIKVESDSLQEFKMRT